jgi:proteasome assembly chaperone (PAC2) family protein
MPEEIKLNNPLLVAVWPGMGNVAITAGYYLMSKLGMHDLVEFSAREHFEVDHVEVKNGIIQSGRLPRSRLFVWNDPEKKQDVLVFIGEAQPPLGRARFCRQLLEFAKLLGVKKVYTFAAMATDMLPAQTSRVFAAATDEETLKELQNQDVEVLEEGHISGLNGVLLGIAKEMGIPGGCLLGEMPSFFPNAPFHGGSLAVLRVFCKAVSLDIDLDELVEQAEEMSQQLSEVLEKVEQKLREQREDRDEDDDGPEFPYMPEEEPPRVSPVDEKRIEQLFARAREDRSKAYELKKELDRLKVFDLYEDRFLDLFKK